MSVMWKMVKKKKMVANYNFSFGLYTVYNYCKYTEGSMYIIIMQYQ